ncbi:hypothetical protein [Fusibacter tunisiensis]|uniref:Flagellar motility protein MotE (MotC chaperone) n=1 Tax=Fusibacter tunisiensis TaxID=1008308 RepID=A0ABS2MMG8_9FIRM|nr:hypothetical protein [Fusibacter tunisiensis]MBM7560585.1 flagellar motility protein MotE (MotC chaperone) [Fusibacter tunisiensis]
MAEIQNNEPSGNESEKKSKGLTGCLVVLLVLLLTPLLVVGGLYFLNNDFNMTVNGLMSNVPGGLGDYFSKFPTRAEQMEQIKQISEFMLDLPEERAVDKLMVLNSEDSGAYNDVVKDMLRLNPNKTRRILDAIRDATVSEDVLQNTLKSIETERQDDLKELAAHIESLPVDSAIQEIESIIESGINGHAEVGSIIEWISDDAAMKILYQMDVEDRNILFSHLSIQKKQAIQQMYSDYTRRTEDLKQIADVYRSEDAEAVAEALGSSGNYSMEELAIIYAQMGPRKAGEVLAKNTDETFVFDLVAQIKATEMLDKGEDLLTPDILKSLKVYREFDDNVRELVNVYARMANTDILPILESMILNSAPSAIYELNNGDLIRISDEDLVLGLLEQFTEKKRSELLALMDSTLSTELTRKLALPQQ